MGFLNTDSMPRLVEKLADGDNIKITGNSKGNRVGTVVKKIVEKADDVTKAIEQEVINDSYSFKVGTGNVDVSSDVEDGFGEVGVKGVTYQNLVDKKVDILNNELTNSTSIGVIYGYANKLKQNTTYTIFYKIKTNQTFNVASMSSIFRIDVFHNNGTQTMPYGFKGQLSDSFKVVCEKFTLSSSDSITKIELNLRNAYGDYGLESNVLTVKEVVILEGDHTNNPNLLSYFEGIVGIGDKIEILSNGKNLFDGKWESGEYTPTTGLKNPNSQKIRSVNSIKVTPNFKYTFSNNGVLRQTNVYVYDCNNVVIDYKNAVTQITPPLNASHITLDGGSSDRDLFQIEKSLTPTTYEPYQEDKTQILLDEPLMRLPNGVCDEITRDGKLIRRVGKIVFDGTENWTGFKTHFEDFDEFSGNIGNHIILQSNSIVNNFPQTNNHRVVTAGNTTYIRLPKGRVNSLNECKQWLSQNPTTVYYELSTPVTTELPAPYLRIFKDGHLTFNTLVAPESTHVVQLNKTAQIERSIREVQGLDGRVGQLESFYDDMMLETSHKLSLLNYDFEYTRERNGE